MQAVKSHRPMNSGPISSPVDEDEVVVTELEHGNVGGGLVLYIDRAWNDDS